MKKTIASMAIVSYFFLLVTGCGKVNPPLNESLRSMQEDGYVNTFSDKSDAHEGVTLSVASIASDGLTTYVRIAIDGELPLGLVADDDENPSNFSLVDDEDELFLHSGESNGGKFPSKPTIGSNHIREATLSDSTGNIWPFRHQTMPGFTGDPYPTLRPTFYDSSLSKNEDVLIFYNTDLSDTVLFSLEVEIRGIVEKFVINNLEVKIAPIATRDFSASNLFYETAFADMQLLSAMSTYLETIFTVKWTIRPGFSTEHYFFRDQKIEFNWGDSSVVSFMIYPNDEGLGDEPIEVVNSYTFAGSMPIDEEITVSALNKQSYENVGTLFVIPAK